MVRRFSFIVVMASAAVALAGCVMPSTSRGVFEPASVTAPPSSEATAVAKPAPSTSVRP
jgi:hypothetical protein